MKFALQLCLAGAALALAACSKNTPEDPPVPAKTKSGLNPQILVGEIDPADKAALSAWIDEAVALFKSPDFETNYKRASLSFPQVFVSKTEDVIPSALLLKRLKTEDRHMTGLWWPKTTVVLDGAPASRAQDQFGFGFKGSRKAIAGPHGDRAKTGQIEIGRLHLARYTQGDAVEKSCALNTLVHEISHTLSDTPGAYHMHILDSQRGVTPPRGIFEASYFIGVVAQCTYLETVGRTAPSEFESCILTFSEPALSSRFRSSACDDFPAGKPISPQGRLHR